MPRFARDRSYRGTLAAAVLLPLPALTAIALFAAPAPQKPTPASLRKAYENNAHTLVEVSGGRRRGSGVIVGAGGQIVTSSDHVAFETATVHLGDREVPARVIAANAALKFAVIEAKLPEGEKLASPPVRTDAVLTRGMWLVGIAPTKRSPHKTVSPAQNPPMPGEGVAGQVLVERTDKSPFVVTDLPLAPGSPLFDTKGKLVAVVVARVGKIGSKALPMSTVQSQVAEAEAEATSP